LSGSRSRLLFLSHILPEPQDSGAAIRTHNTLRILGAAYDLTALCFARPATSALAGSIADRAQRLSAYGQILPFPIPATLSRLRNARDHVKSLATATPWVRHLYDSGAYRRLLDQLLRSTRFDLVHVESLDLVGYLDRVRHLPLVCVHHNVESSLLVRRADGERQPIKRAYIRWQAELMRREEVRWCPEAELNVVVSEEDCRLLREIAPRATYQVFPNGVDVEHYRPGGPGPADGLVFVGGTNWFPNRDALEFFRDEILPELHRRGERPAVRWIGHASPADRSRYGGDGVTLTGYVADDRPVVRDARCFVVPLRIGRIGGGTRLKILNAWAMGKAVVSTSIGCEGLEARHGENILIADAPSDFAEAVARVLHDDTLRARLEARGRATAVERYSWDVIGARMIDAYRAVEAE
jgi:glycosyltransferase involved in cell wall biosynthesis